ncbi:MAG: dihydroxyacetone kinase subunit L [Phycisphaerae bacterium]|nr:dihydroxyacetone kinase subunit L [Phycisphaerae bacterium]
MKLGYGDFVKMFRQAIQEIQANHPMLSKLDSFGGDGDHGTTMLRAMGCLEKGINQTTNGSLGDLLNNIGWAIMGVDGGATGPLLGSFFSGMAEKAPATNQADIQALAAMFEAGWQNLSTLTQAKVGDKTLVDALIPAVDTLRAAAQQNQSISIALQTAAAAAARGAQATQAMQPRFGRAKNLGAAAMGHPDAGATSVSLLFKGFAEGVNSHAG